MKLPGVHVISDIDTFNVEKVRADRQKKKGRRKRAAGEGGVIECEGTVIVYDRSFSSR